MNTIDLHLHSRFSDGMHAPAEVVRIAAAAGVTLLALTDHDTVAGLGEGLATAAALPGVTMVTGIEFSADQNRKEYHIVGYGIAPAHPGILALTRRIFTGRQSRAQEIVARLRALGIGIEFAALAPPPGGIIGRMHIARQLIRLGAVASNEEAFQKYLKLGRPAFVPHPEVSPLEIIATIRNAGGLAVWAHPMYTNDDAILPRLIDGGLRGIEAYHHDQPPAVQRRYAKIARENGLLVTGGTDWHGEVEYAPYLNESVMPTDWAEPFLAALDQSGNHDQSGRRPLAEAGRE